MKKYKVYNVDVWDIQWCDEHYIPKNLPTTIENLTIHMLLNSTYDDMLNDVLSELEYLHTENSDNPVYIVTAKIKVNNSYFLIDTIEGIN
jgi:hypothetical protein